LSVTSSKPSQRRGFFPMLPGSFHGFFANPYRTPFNVAPEDVAQVCLDYIEKTLFSTICPPEDVAAILVEPIQGEGGYIVPAQGFLCGLREICDRHGILLIFDEVQSGVGRTGKMWAFEHECAATTCGDGSCSACGRAKAGVVPDIVASAKGLGGGVPIGAMIARRDLMERWQPGAHGNTYGGNALVCAAAYEVLDLVEHELTANAARVGDYLMNGLLALKERYEVIGDVRGRGLMLGIDFVKDRGTKEYDKALANAMMEESFKRGMLVLTCGASTVRLCPPLVLTEAQADEALTIFESTLQSLV
ncbi:MAG: aminotransferase class III-fold pyridoxal phosphate-dependent enzyme, partial [Roseiflexaceae bacterium]|nr:aminotransferase class III-fold pyridoxal phosphate-dependent enzyme [Roseiflexaceae bacterium]